MIKRTLAVVAALLLLGGSGAQAASKRATCDRACLAGAMTAYLNALAKHDPSRAPLSKAVRFTENTMDLMPGEGLWTTITGLGTFREDFLDVRAGIAGSHVVVQDAGRPALLAVRLKVVRGMITEIETQVTNSPPTGQRFEVDTLKTPNPEVMRILKPSERMSRAELVRISDFYPAGLKAGSFATVDAPMAPDATRNENGGWAAGPFCTSRPTCKDMKTQPLGAGRTHFQDRVLLVDEQTGVVWRRMSWLPPGGKDERLVAFEIFKIYGGQMHVVEAFLRTEPLSSVSGWG